MSIRSILAAVALTAGPVLCAPALAPASPTPLAVEPRSVISHDAIVGFTEAVPDSIAGSLMLKYKPRLKVTNGCVPFPAVDAQGNTRFEPLLPPEPAALPCIRHTNVISYSGGLKPTGSSNGHCSSSAGQVYARGAAHGEYFAIMYSW